MARMESVSSERVLFCGTLLIGVRMVGIWWGSGTMIHFPSRFLRVLEDGAAILLAESMVVTGMLDG